jgi:hypothetical protein
MKLIENIITIALITLISNKSSAQTTTYDTCNSLQQLEGEWRYTNGQDTIRLYLRYARTLSSSLHHLSDALYGWHEYKKGNITVESNYQNRFLPIPYNSDEITPSLSGIYLQAYRNNLSSNKLIGSICDIIEVGEFHIVTSILSNNNTVLTWNQDHREGFGFLTNHKGMTLPRNFVLIKQ